MDCTPVDRKCGDKMISATYKGRNKNNKQKRVLGNLFIYREERVADKLMRVASVWDPSPLMPGWCIFGLSWSAGVGSMHLGLLNSLICIVFIYWIHACSTVSFPFHSSILFAFPIRILILRRQVHWKFSFKKTNKQTKKSVKKGAVLSLFLPLGWKQQKVQEELEVPRGWGRRRGRQSALAEFRSKWYN